MGDRKLDVVCVQKTRWMVSGCRFGAVGKRYKLLWCECQEKTEGVGVFVAEKWVDQVVEIHRYNESIAVVKEIE